MKKNKAFTLIELLVVIAIIGILSAIVLVSLAGARDRAKDARIQADMYQVRSVAETFFSGAGHYDWSADTPTTTAITTLTNDITAQNTGATFTLLKSGAGSAADKYCAIAKLNNGNWCCVDSKLASKCYTDPTTNPSTSACGGAAPTYVCP